MARYRCRLSLRLQVTSGEKGKEKKKKEQKKEGGVGSKKRKVLKGSGPPCFAAVIVVSRDVCRIGDLVT